MLFIPKSHFANHFLTNFLKTFKFSKAKFTMDNYKKCLIAVTQMTSTEDKERNWQQMEALVHEAVAGGAKVVFLPEGCDYIASSRAESLQLAESISGFYVSRLKELAKSKAVWLSVGGIHLKEPTESLIRNTHLLFSSEGELVSQYAKTHLFSNNIPGVSINEGDYVKSGENVVPPTSTPAGNIALSICYDLRFPELSQVLRRLGAHILTFPSAFTVKTGEAHWETLLRSRAIECQSYVVAAAQTGKHNNKRSSYGHAMIVDPWGRVLSHLPEGVGVSLATVDINYLAKVRREMPCIDHSRQDIFPVTLKPIADIPCSPILQALPPDSSSLQFGGVTVPGGGVFMLTSHSYAFTNLFPRVPGLPDCMVSPLRVVRRLTSLTASELCDLSVVTLLTHRLLCKMLSVSSCEVAMQDGPNAGQTIKHVHIHLLPSPGDSSPLSPDMSQSLVRTEEKVSAMISAATSLSRDISPSVIKREQDEHFIPQSPAFSTLPHEGAVPQSSQVLSTNLSFCYSVQGHFQPHHLIIETKREVSSVSDLRPSEVYELFACAQKLQSALELKQPNVSSTLILKPADSVVKTVHLHLIPWEEPRSDSDAVYSYVRSYERTFTHQSQEFASTLSELVQGE